MTSFTLDSTPNDFKEYLKANDITRLILYYDVKTSSIKISHQEKLSPITDYFSEHPDWQDHEGCFIEIGKRSGALMGAFVWRTNRGQGCGGVRFRNYQNIAEYFRDGLRLSLGMGQKNACAGLWSGGGKGAVHAPDRSEVENYDEWKRNMCLDYGDLLSSINGCYVTAEDMGMNVSDLDIIHSRSRFTTCISNEIGGSGNPSVPTARGIFTAIGAVLDWMQMGDVEGKSFAVQGAGNVASPLRYRVKF